jgi:hypothetical protein
LDISAGTTGEYLNNAGTVAWTGTAVATPQQTIVDGIGTPVLNTGTFNADGGTKGVTTVVAGVLLVSNKDAATNNVSFDQTTGTFNLTNGAGVTVSQGYYQSGGSLTSDASTCNLTAGVKANGDINIFNGQVVVDTVPNSVGTLQFIASTVEIDGVIELNGQTVQGGKSNLCDLLDCGNATVTLGADSALDVGTTGTAPLGTGNQWLAMKYGSLGGSWGMVVVPSTMTASIGSSKILVTN